MADDIKAMNVNLLDSYNNKRSSYQPTYRPSNLQYIKHQNNIHTKKQSIIKLQADISPKSYQLTDLNNYKDFGD